MKDFKEILNRNLDQNSSTKPGDNIICKSCGENFIRGDWCFHLLCDKCFYLFDDQKMRARFSFGSMKGFEDVDEWIAETKCELN